MAGRYTSDAEIEAVKANWVRSGQWLTLNVEAKQAIAEQYRRGESTCTLAEMYGVSSVSIGSWMKSVGEPLRTGSQSAKQRPHPRRYALNEAAFDQINEHSAYWIGFLMADGCISQGPKGQRVLWLGINEIDEGHVRKFAEFLGTNKPIETRTKAMRKDGTPTVMTCIQISSDRLAYALSQYGVVPRKAHTATVSGLEMNRDFWRGAIDGDGCLRFTGKSPHLNLCGSKSLTRQFLDFCKSIDPSTPDAAYGPQKGTSWVVNLFGARAIKVVTALYEQSSVHLDRKKEVAGRIVDLSRWFRPGQKAMSYRKAPAA